MQPINNNIKHLEVCKQRIREHRVMSGHPNLLASVWEWDKTADAGE